MVVYSLYKRHEKMNPYIQKLTALIHGSCPALADGTPRPRSSISAATRYSKQSGPRVTGRSTSVFTDRVPARSTYPDFRDNKTPHLTAKMYQQRGSDIVLLQG